MLNCCQMSIISFSEWLQYVLKERGLTQADLARESGVDKATISRALKMERLPSTDSLQLIAKALGMPTTAVYRAAGLLPDLIDPRQAAVEILGYKLEELDDTQLDEVLQFIEFIQSRDDRRAGKGVKKTREGAAPPEAIKE